MLCSTLTHTPTPPPARAPDADLDVVHEDAHLLVLCKPAGLLAVPGRGADRQDCLSARAQRRWPDALVVHRLDMATSGLMLMARGPDMQRAMSLAFEQHHVHKKYEAVVDGRPQPESADAGGWSTIHLPIAADWPNRPLRVVDAVSGKPSLTRWRALAYEAAADTTRVSLEPVTGRTHQLRVHMKAIGHPILGDMLYADAATQARAPRLLLHACFLAFKHPETGEPLVFSSPAPF